MRPSPILALILLAQLLANPALSAPADDSRPIVPASEILAKIERGEDVYYDGVIVEGDLHIFGYIKSPIVITNSDIRGSAICFNTIFLSPVSFVNTQFSRDAHFSAEFEGSVIFRNTTFRERPDFWNAEFNTDATFCEAQFCKGAFFCNAHFGNNSLMGADFRCAQFDEGAVFDNVTFSKRPNFDWAFFNSLADFHKAFFVEDAYFMRTQFTGGVRFDEAHFGGDPLFFGAEFKEVVSFRGAKFEKNVHLEATNFDHANLILDDSKFDAMSLLATTFENESTISLNSSDFYRLYVSWDSIRESFVCNGPAYLALIKNFKELEQFEDADDCYYEYRKWRQGTKDWFCWSKCIDILAWLTCGYGVRPSYTLYWSFGIIFFFGLIFWAFNGIHRIAMQYQENALDSVEKRWSIYLICCMLLNKISNMLRKILSTPKILRKIARDLMNIRPSTLRRLPGRIWNASFVTEVSFKDALYFSTMVFVSMPPHDWRPKEGWKYWVMLEDVLGWLLLALFLVTLGNVMIR